MFSGPTVAREEATATLTFVGRSPIASRAFPENPRRSAIVAGPDVPDQVVYDFCKTIIDHNEELALVHADCATLNLDNALDGLQVPLHPGAEQYYKEVGLIE